MDRTGFGIKTNEEKKINNSQRCSSSVKQALLCAQLAVVSVVYRTAHISNTVQPADLWLHSIRGFVMPPSGTEQALHFWRGFYARWQLFPQHGGEIKSAELSCS